MSGPLFEVNVIMEFDQVQKNWNEFGKKDPLWAILTRPEAKNNKWDIQEFFRTGDEEITYIMQYADSLDTSLARQKALDFGCGVGRLTQSLCRYFDQCYGVDIAPSMIELAEKYNRYGNKCSYYVNEAKDLSLFEDNSFDFIYSNIVLQHMKPEYSKNYIKEFLRVLAVDGLLIFQLPSEPAPIQAGLAPDQSAITEPLPDSAFKADITLQEPFTTVEPGSPITITVKVKNSSDITWPMGGSDGQYYQIRLGNHWLKQGELLVKDDARASLLKDLKPMEEVDLNLTVTTPMQPGSYFLEPDMVQEGVAWFKDKGSKTTKVCIQVEGSCDAIKTDPDSELMMPIMEMYGVNKDVVSELITSCNGELVDIQEDHSAGPSWLSFRYCVRKSSGPTQAQLQQTQAQLQQTQVALEQAQGTITAMESSKFWKLRTTWFRLKKLIGMAGDE